jgi:hypothetical protein
MLHHRPKLVGLPDLAAPDGKLESDMGTSMNVGENQPF